MERKRFIISNCLIGMLLAMSNLSYAQDYDHHPSMTISVTGFHNSYHEHPYRYHTYQRYHGYRSPYHDSFYRHYYLPYQYRYYDSKPYKSHRSHKDYRTGVWEWSSNGTVPTGAVIVGHHQGYPLYRCKTYYEGRDYYGHVKERGCHFKHRGRFKSLPRYRVWVQF